VTVQAEESAVPTVDLATAEEQYEDAYRRWWKPLTYFIAARLDGRHRSNAEDIAAETFTELWTNFAMRGKDIGFVWSLLCTMARFRIANFYGHLAATRETAVDFADPLNRGIEAGHSYAANQPEAAGLAAELSAAMEVMAELSKKWRDAHTKTSMYRSRLEGGAFPMRPETRVATEQKLAGLISDRDRLLTDFRQACSDVGELRRDLEAAGGPNWCSSTGLPPSQQRNWTKDLGTMSDPTRTHCDDGHELTLENTHFTYKGAQRCRTCMEVTWRASRAANPPKSKATVKAPREYRERQPAHRVAEETIQRARELLKNPDLSIRQVAEMVGVGKSTLAARIPDMDQLRHVDRRRVTGTPQELLDKAVQLLTDPDNRRSVRSVCDELGFSDATLYTRVRNLAALRREAYGRPLRVLTGAAR
jgi:DNA-directed RNA polymerase specialized sigma24 family protein